MDTTAPQPPDGQEIIDIDSDSPVESPVYSPPESPGDIEFLWDNPRPAPMQDEPPVLSPRLPSAPPSTTAPGTYEGCLLAITAVFPDISNEHVEQLWNKTERANFLETDALYQHLIEQILDGGPYPKERDRLKDLKKRKRASPEVEAAKWKYSDLRHDPEEYARVAKARLCERFDMVPTKFIHDTFKEHSHFYGAFFAIDKAERTRDDASGQPFQKLKSRRVSNMKSEQIMASLEAVGFGFAGLKEEMRAAETRWQKAEDERNAAKELAKAKMASDEEYRRNGETLECACCFSDDNPPTDMTHCNGDTPHFFCFACARRNAETDMTSLKYALRCMDQSRCEATFSRDERARFMDAAAIDKLERLQQQDEIRRAEMGDLEACPFCEYVAICPLAEVNRVFECQNPDCMEISCRLCKEKAHIPLTCEEFKKENGIGERHAIEEARTNALVRSCKKCNVRILKEDGCNKVVCTNCYSVICDYCGEDISKTKYDHFDSSSGVARPVKGKCPLYDPSDRKNEQIEKAGKAAMEKVRAENPNLSEEDLKIKFAKSVEDQSRRPRDVSEEELRRLEERFLARRAQLNPGQEHMVPGFGDAGDAVRRMHEAMQNQFRGDDHNALRRQVLHAGQNRGVERDAQRLGEYVQRIRDRRRDRRQSPPGLPDLDMARVRGRNRYHGDVRQDMERFLHDHELYQAEQPHETPVPDGPINPHAQLHHDLYHAVHPHMAPVQGGLVNPHTPLHHNHDLYKAVHPHMAPVPNGPIYPATPLRDIGRPMNALQGSMGSVDEQQERIARDFPPGDFGFGPLTKPHNNFPGPARTDEQPRGGPPNEDTPHHRKVLRLQNLAELDRIGGDLDRRAGDQIRRNNILTMQGFNRPFLVDPPRRVPDQRQDGARPSGTDQRLPTPRPARRRFPVPDHAQNINHRDLAQQMHSVYQDLGDFEVPNFDHSPERPPRDPHNSPPFPPRFEHAMDAPVELEADPAEWRDHFPLWNVNQRMPDFPDEPGSIFGPLGRRGRDRRHTLERLAIDGTFEDGETVGSPETGHGQY